MIPTFAKNIQGVNPILAKDWQSMRSLVVSEAQHHYVQKNAAHENTQTGCTVENSEKVKCYRSSRQDVFCKKCIFKKCSQEKPGLESPNGFIKERLQRRCFSLSFGKYLSTAFIQIISRSLVLYNIQQNKITEKRN